MTVQARIDDSILHALRVDCEYGLVALAGGGKTGATQMLRRYGVHVFGTCATAADSAMLPPCEGAPRIDFVRNDGAAAMQIYAPESGTINGIATGTGVSLIAGGAAWFVTQPTNPPTVVTGTLPTGANTVLVSRASAQEQVAGTTLTNTALTLTGLTAGKTYRIDALLKTGNGTAGGGFKFDFNGGTATMTSVMLCAYSMLSTTLQGTTNMGALNTPHSIASAGTGTIAVVSGTVVVNAAGTLRIRLAENSAAALAVIDIGSYLMATPLD